MPIYAYRCEHCGHAQDVLQKVSDPVLTVCPRCGQPTFRKQVTAAGFQLKGSGWYVTDFKGDKKPPAKPLEPADAAGAPAGADGTAKTGGDAAANGATATPEAKVDGAKAAAPAPATTTKPAAPKGTDP